MLLLENGIIIFIKYPEKGRVKTRLAQRIGAEKAINLYKIFVSEIIENLKVVKADLNICFTPKGSKCKLKEWLGEDYSYSLQRGKDLGERMENSFRRLFAKGYKKVVLVGSDIPDLDYNIVNKALSSLSKYDAVIGPSFDGGYYLIGFKNNTFLPEAFRNIRWSSDSVFNNTMRILKENRRRVKLMDKKRDIDTIHDLKEFLNSMGKGSKIKKVFYENQ
jgi:hypothetical protein